jgi:hypothetical protein
VGPLKCPVCPLALRRNDAMVALGGNSGLIREWDTKIQNGLLRPSPNCSYNSLRPNSYKRSLVTPECLQEDQRSEAANKPLRERSEVVVVLVVGYLTSTLILTQFPSRFNSIDFLLMFLLIYPFAAVGLAVHHWLVQEARRIAAVYPCSNQPDILPTESKSEQELQSLRWLNENTRKCPSCSVHIIKTGGCNNMTCSYCQANFCWSCMRLLENCTSLGCAGGIQYGNTNRDMD